MDINVVRPKINPKADTTISELYIDGKLFCYVLEDKDRGLSKSDPLSHIVSVKVPAQTAIPYGTYEVVINFSNRFQKYLPQLLDVPGFSGIRIHPGNNKDHTEGCLLLGTSVSGNTILESRKAMSAFMKVLESRIKKEKITCTITSVKL